MPLVLFIGIGPVKVSPLSTAKIMLSYIPGLEEIIGHMWTRLEENIAQGLRLPRVLPGLIMGASLAVTGVTMQIWREISSLSHSS